MKTTHRATALLLALAFAAPAFATSVGPKAPHKPKPAPDPAPTTTVHVSPEADAHAAASAHAAAQAAAQAAAIAAQQQHQQQQQAQQAISGSLSGATGGDGGAGGQGVGSVDASHSSRSRSLGIALHAPAATAAPAAEGQCLNHSRGWTMGMGFLGRSGGTHFDGECVTRQHCLAIADRYAQAGMLQAMADQLATCGGVSVTIAPPAPVAPPAAVSPPPGTIDRAELEAAVRRLEERQDRAFERGLGKAP